VRSPELQELALLEADAALRAHWESANYRRARGLWAIYCAISVAAMVSGVQSSAPLRVAAGAASLLALLAALPWRGSARFRRLFPTLLLGYLLGESVLWVWLASDGPLAVAFAVSLAPLALLLLRLRAMELSLVAAVTWGGLLLRGRALPAASGGAATVDAGALVAVGVVLAVAAAIGSSLTARARQEFLLLWRQAATRERERLRMREELNDARAVQLAMLPRDAPSVAGLEVAAVCVPASEVGGDYYDYFATAGGGLAVAIGDVAGHGMASGLVLAGVRSGLHLLADEIASDPAQVLGRLNSVVAGPSGQRLLMTLALAHFDRAARRATWVSAGHPPPLCFSAAKREIESPPSGHPPLGTRLPVRPEALTRPLLDGDVWMLVSDGVLEARDAQGREFGEHELVRSFRRLAEREERAGAILDGLLAEISRFRGGAPQDDDLTIVVVRVVAS